MHMIERAYDPVQICNYVQYLSMVTRSLIFMPSDSESSQVTGGSELFAPSMPFWNSSRGVSGLFAVTGDFIYRFDLAVEECQFQMGNRETALSSIRVCGPLLRIQLTLWHKLYLSITADSVAHWPPLVSNS